MDAGYGFEAIGMVCSSDSTARALFDNSPITAVVRNSTAIAFCEIATQKAAANRDPGSDDHEEDASRDSAHDVGEEKDGDPHVHKNRQHSSKHTPHVALLLTGS